MGNINQEITQPALNAVSITVATAVAARCRAVWVGTTQSIDLSFDGTTWVTFQGATSGTIIPARVVGARKTAAAAAPTAGDILFLY